MKNFSNYLTAIARANGLGNEVSEWLFYTGMLQDSREKWWADFGRRHAAHEGIDICFYKKKGNVSALAPGALVPALADGILLNLSSDLLGQSMAVSFDPGPYSGDTPVLVYSHLEPDPELTPGDRISKGDIIAKTFDARLRNSRLLSHLHLSCVLVCPPIDNTGLDWSLFSDRDKVSYVNPIFI